MNCSGDVGSSVADYLVGYSGGEAGGGEFCFVGGEYEAAVCCDGAY